MKYYSGTSLFQFTWDHIASAFWVRYPNPHSSHVLTEDTLLRELRGNLLYTQRLITKTNHLPKWGERFVPGPRHVCVLEESILDPEKKTLTTYTRNIGLTRVMLVEEKCVYHVSRERNNLMDCQRHAWVGSSVYGFGYALQKFGMERYKKNAKKAHMGFEDVLKRLYLPESETVVDHKPLSSLVGMHAAEKLREKAQEKAQVAQEKAQKAKKLAKTVVVTN